MAPVYEIKRYTPQQQSVWDALVETSVNGTFLFKRDYMVYHAHRFVDFSLMVYSKNKPVALLPASIRDGEVTSHGSREIDSR